MNINLSKTVFLSIGVLILAIVVFGCIKEKTEKADMPKWFLNIPEYPNAYVAVGSGDGRAEALCNALSELSFQIEIELSILEDKSNASKFSRSDKGLHLGKVSIQSILTDFRLDNGSKEHTSLISTVSFTDQTKKYKISTFYEETTNNGVTTSRTHFEITSKNCVLEDVLEELKRLVIGIETYASEDAYYVKLVADKDKLKSNIP